MTTFEEKKFSIPALKGISEKAITEHLKLYSGYVKFANVILAKIAEYSADSEKHAYALGELQRRFSFEFDGMRNHEYYFHSFEGGSKPLPAASALKAAVEKEWGSWDGFMNRFKAACLTRGVGWAMLEWDTHTKHLVINWNDEQHLGHLTGCQPILAVDMWEHAFLFDYVPADKKKYVEAFFENVNWEVIEANFTQASK